MSHEARCSMLFKIDGVQVGPRYRSPGAAPRPGDKVTVSTSSSSDPVITGTVKEVRHEIFAGDSTVDPSHIIWVEVESEKIRRMVK